jgi:hypothetical protein
MPGRLGATISIAPAHNSNQKSASRNSFRVQEAASFRFLNSWDVPGVFQTLQKHENKNDSYFEVVHSSAGNRGAQRGRSSRSARHSSLREFLIKRKGQDVHKESREGRNDGSRDGKIG